MKLELFNNSEQNIYILGDTTGKTNMGVANYSYFAVYGIPLRSYIVWVKSDKEIQKNFHHMKFKTSKS